MAVGGKILPVLGDSAFSHSILVEVIEIECCDGDCPCWHIMGGGGGGGGGGSKDDVVGCDG